MRRHHAGVDPGAGSARAPPPPPACTLIAPPVQAAGGGKQFPADSEHRQPELREHRLSAAQAVLRGLPHLELRDRAAAVLRQLRHQRGLRGGAVEDQSRRSRTSRASMSAWPPSSTIAGPPQPGGAPDCPGSAAAMLAAITAFANGIPVTPIDPSLVVSNARHAHAGHDRRGRQSLRGEPGRQVHVPDRQRQHRLRHQRRHAGGGPVAVGQRQLGGRLGHHPRHAAARRRPRPAPAQKFAAMIQSSGEYSIEAWVAPANVTQTNAYIVSYSGSNTTRDMTLGQDAMQYEGMARSSVTDTNGKPPLITDHGGRRGAGGPAARGAHLRSGQRPEALRQRRARPAMPTRPRAARSPTGTAPSRWCSATRPPGSGSGRASIKFAAIHNRALTPAQIQQNFAAGVGEKYFLLFGVSALSGRAAVVHPLPGEPVRHLQLPVLPAEVHQPRSEGHGPGEPEDQRHAPRRERRAGPGGPVVRHHERHGRRRELHRRQRPAALGPGHAWCRPPSDRTTTCSSCPSTSSARTCTPTWNRR